MLLVNSMIKCNNLEIDLLNRSFQKLNVFVTISKVELYIKACGVSSIAKNYLKLKFFCSDNSECYKK